MSKKNNNSKSTGRFRPRGAASSNSNAVNLNKKSANKETLLDLKSLSQEIQNHVSKFIQDEEINGEVLGVIKSSDMRYYPVIHDSSLSYPVIYRKFLTKNYTDQSIKELVSQNINYFSNIKHMELRKSKSEDGLILIRTFALNTLQDALNSTIKISLKEVLVTLKKTLMILKKAHAKGFVHGHVHPGNICFKLDMSGGLLDGGIFTNLIPNKVKNNKDYVAPESATGSLSTATDMYGFGSTLKAVIECPSIICEEKDLRREEVLAVLKPIIESSTKADPNERMTIEIASAIYNDLLPLILSPKEISSLEEEYLEHGDNTKIDEDTIDLIEDREEYDLSFEVETEDAIKDDLIFKDEAEITNKFENIAKEAFHSYNNKKSISLGKVILITVITGLMFLAGNKLINSFSLIKEAVKIASTEDAFNGQILDTQELASAWSSGILSQMKLVADQAIYKNQGRVLAERTILSSVTNNELKSDLVDSSLIRVAFNPQWEEQLNEDDRRYALALALVQIVKNQIPRDLGRIEERNPAVLLALMSSSSQGVSKILSTVSVKLLEKLPVPYGPAFQLLATTNSDKHCGDEDILTLARIGTRGVENPVLLNQFLSGDFKRRMSALAILFSSQPENARKVIDVITLHPNLALNNQEVIWAKKVSLVDWQEIDPSDKLFLLAGVPLRGNNSLSAASVAKLFLNPSPRVRGFAAGLALEKIQFLHKGAPEILQMIQNAPDMLSQDQLVMLGQILEDPKKTAEAHRKIVQSFIASNPPVDIAKHLLISSATEVESTILDSALGIYLGEKGWVPNDTELQILSHHPDKVTRMFAYQTIFTTIKGPKAIELLKKSLTKENDMEYKSQLKDMIAKLQMPSMPSTN